MQARNKIYRVGLLPLLNMLIAQTNNMDKYPMNETRSEDTTCPPGIHSNTTFGMNNTIYLEKIGLGDTRKTLCGES